MNILRNFRPHLFAIIVFGLLMLTYAIAHAAQAPVGDPQRDEMVPYADWVLGLKNPITGQGCCSLSDCRFADYRINKDGVGYEAYLDDKTWAGAPNAWVLVPDQLTEDSGEAHVACLARLSFSDGVP